MAMGRREGGRPLAYTPRDTDPRDPARSRARQVRAGKTQARGGQQNDTGGRGAEPSGSGAASRPSG